jgi:4-hydroxy-2-oxoheptanedioate aldolase
MRVVPTNQTKQKLASGRVAVGAIIGAPAPELIEIAALAGFDFVTFDAEHEPLDDGQLVDLIRTAEACDITPIIRIAKDPDRLLRLLDAGTQGIHVPRCNNVADMEQLVEWTRFHPLGQRTFYRLGRGGNYGRGLHDSEWARQSNDQLLVTAMIEEVSALDHLEKMLAVAGIDAIHIGPKDLWQSMGMPPDDQVDAVIARIATAVRAAGKHLSLQIRALDDIQTQIDRNLARGANLLSIPLAGLLLRGSEALVRQVRASAPSGS